MKMPKLDISYADERLASEFDTPEHRLWASVAELAVRDYVEWSVQAALLGRKSKGLREVEEYLFEMHYGFEAICDLLKLDVQTLRAGIRKKCEQAIFESLKNGG